MASIGTLRWTCAGAGLPATGLNLRNLGEDLVRRLLCPFHGVLRIDEQALPARRARAFGRIGGRRGQRGRSDDGGGRLSNRRLLLQLEAIHTRVEIDLETWPLRDILAARNRDVIAQEHGIGLGVEDRPVAGCALALLG